MMKMIIIIIIYLGDYQATLRSNNYDDDNNDGGCDYDSGNNDNDLLQFFCLTNFIFVLLFRASCKVPLFECRY